MLFRYLRGACAGLAVALGVSALVSAAPVLAAGGLPSTHQQVAAAAPAKLAPWRVIEITGEARARVPGTAFQSLSVGDDVPIGYEVVTGRNSELVLERAKDHMTLSAATWVRLAPPQPGGLLDRFVQSIGTILYDVEPRHDRSFGVEAPYVAAVVKGTRFTVTAGLNQSSVRVERGKVLVTASDGKGSALVEAGSTAVASPRKQPGLLIVGMDQPIKELPTRPIEEDAMSVADAGNTVDGVLAGSPATGGGLGDTHGATSTVGHAASGASGSVGGTVSSGTSGTLGGTVEGTTDKVGDLAGGIVGAVGGAVASLGGTVGSAVGGSLDQTGDAVGGTVDTVGKLVGDTTKTVGGLVGGLTGGLGRALR